MGFLDRARSHSSSPKNNSSLFGKLFTTPFNERNSLAFVTSHRFDSNLTPNTTVNTRGIKRVQLNGYAEILFN